MGYYRDTANALATRAPGDHLGVALYVSMSSSASVRWDMQTFRSLAALKEWFEEIAGAPTLYYYLAAFDKTRSLAPIVDSIAPPKPGMPGFDIYSRWRHPAFPTDRPAVAGSGEVGESKAVSIAKTAAIFTLFAIPFGILVSKAQEKKQLQAEKAEFRRIGWDWGQRARH